MYIILGTNLGVSCRAVQRRYEALYKNKKMRPISLEKKSLFFVFSYTFANPDSKFLDQFAEDMPSIFKY
jgi:hypothetical protein